MKSMSAFMHRQKLMEAARRTFYCRSEVVAKTKATFATCVATTPCHVTLPTIASDRVALFANVCKKKAKISFLYSGLRF
jgi:hypothetical protein